MKNFLFAFVAGCIPALAVTNEVYAQASNNITTIELPKHFLKMDMDITPEKDNTINMNEISSKAVKDLKRSYKDLKRSYSAGKGFRRSYKNASDAKWYRIQSGFTAEFTSNGVNNKIFYGQAGQWTASLKSYNEDKLAGDIKDIVKSEYHDYKINFVEEIETTATHGVPTYVVHIENDNNIKLVRVSGGEMDVYKEFSK